MTARDILMAAAGSAAAPTSYTFAKTYAYSAAATTFYNSVTMSNGKIAVGIATTAGSGFQMYNADGSLSGQAYVISGLSFCLLETDGTNLFLSLGGTVVLKCSTSGVIAWQKTGFNSAVATIQMNQPSYNPVTGYLFVTGAKNGGGYPGLVCTLDPSTGALNWAKTAASSLSRTEFYQSGWNGTNYFAAGLFGSYDAAVIKFDSSGNSVLQSKHGYDCTGFSVNSSGYYALATYYSQPSPGIRVFDPSGTCVSGVNYNTLGTSGDYTNPTVFLNNDGTFISVFRDIADATYNSLAAFKHATDGSVVWSKKYRWSSNIRLDIYRWGLERTASGNYVFVGVAPASTANGLIFEIDQFTGSVTTSSSTWLEGSPSITSTPSTVISSSSSDRTITTVTPTLTNTSYTFTNVTLTQVLTA